VQKWRGLIGVIEEESDDTVY